MPVATDSPDAPPSWPIYPPPPPKKWHWTASSTQPEGHGLDKDEIFEVEKAKLDRDEGLDEANDWVMGEDGVFQVWQRPAKTGGEKRQVGKMPGLREYFMDLDYSQFFSCPSRCSRVVVLTKGPIHLRLTTVLGVCADGPAKSFAYRRLKFLQSKFEMYQLLS